MEQHDGLETIYCEIDGLIELSETLQEDASLFNGAVNAVLDTDGKVIVCGMGKSGIVGKKISASLSSTGTPSIFLHPGEAFHGDLGMVGADDVILAISNSGETEEILKLLPYFESNGNVIVSFTKDHNNTLAKAANFNIRVGVSKEACPLQLAPTSSTTAAMVMGDALTVALLKARDFTSVNFARFHPGGTLGRKLLLKVSDVMVTDNLPFVKEDTPVIDLIHIMGKGKVGLAIIGTPTDVDGILTDGDIRRSIETIGEITSSVYLNKTCRPITCHPNMRFGDAAEIMESNNITSLLVVDAGLLVGILKK